MHYYTINEKVSKWYNGRYNITYKDFSHSINKCDITYILLFTVISKVTKSKISYKDRYISPILSVISIVIISKFIRIIVVIR